MPGIWDEEDDFGDDEDDDFGDLEDDFFADKEEDDYYEDRMTEEEDEADHYAASSPSYEDRYSQQYC